MAAPNVVPFPPEPPPDLLEEIARREEERLRSLSKSYARQVPIASDIDPQSCLRRQVLEIVSWQDKPLPGPTTQARFEIGSLHEREALIRLKRLGFDVVEEQVPFELKRRGGSGEVVLRGRLDAKIRWLRAKVPVEVKSFFPLIYDRINTAEDLERYWWTKKYPSQLQAYLIGYDDSPGWGFFYLTDCLGHWKAIRIEADFELAERIWSFAESVTDGVRAHRADGSLPPFTQDPTQCRHCEFFGRTCQPDTIEQGGRLLTDPELEAQIARWLELRHPYSEYNSVDRRVKDALKVALPERPEARGIVGRFAVTITDKPVKAEAKPRPARTDRVVSIEALGAEEGPRG